MKQAESRFYLQRAVLEIVSCGFAQSFEVLAWSPFSCAEAGWGSYQWMRHGTKLQCRETARPVECFELQRLLLKQQRFASILVIMDSATARSRSRSPRASSFEDEQFDVEVESVAEEQQLDGQAWQLDFNSFGTGPVGVDMVFKEILPRELPMGDDVLYISREDAAPKIYPERGSFIHLAAHPADVFCSAPPGCRSLFSGKRKICEALVKQGLQLVVPCLTGESLMLGMTKIPCKMFLAALESCMIFTVYVGHFGAQWPCATIGDGVHAGVLHGLSSWHTGVDLACRLGDKTKILVLGFNIGDTSGVTNIPAFHPAMCPLTARVHPILPELQQGSYPVVRLGFIEGTFKYKVSSPDRKNHTLISCLLGRSK